MSQPTSWNPPPRPGPPFGGPQGSPPPPAYASPRPPGLATTVVITFFFGLFGAIAAAVHSDRAGRMGISGARYWKAFALTFVVVYLLVPGVLLALFWGSVMSGLGAMNDQQSAPSLATPRPYASGSPAASSWGRVTASARATTSTGSGQNQWSAPQATATAPQAATGGSFHNPALSSGSWITVLDSLDKGEYSAEQAQARAAGLSNGSYSVSVIDTDPVPGLNSGYYALAVINRSSKSDASSVCSAFGRGLGGDCYPRQIG